MKDLIFSVPSSTLCKFKVKENMNSEINLMYFFRKADYLFGCLTIYFTIQPSILANLSTFHSDKSFKKFVDHLPIMHLKTHLGLQRKIALKQREAAETNQGKEHQNYLESQIQEFETELQKVKVFTSMGESVPQFVLALSILMKQHSLNTWIYALNPLEDPWAILTLFQVSTSLLSAMTSVTSIYTDFPLNGDPPIRSAGYKFFQILPLMFLIATPRLYSLSTIYSQASFYDAGNLYFNWENCLFYIFFTFIMLGLYGLAYKGLCHWLKKRDDSLQKGMSFLGFFTSIISPSIVGSYFSHFFLLTSLLSSLFHALLISIFWITSIYLPNIFCPPYKSSEMKQEILEDLQLHCLILIPILLFGTLVSYLMHRLYLKKNIPSALKSFIKDKDQQSIEKLVKKFGIEVFNAYLPGGDTPVTFTAGHEADEETPHSILELFVSKHEEWKIDFSRKSEYGSNALMLSAKVARMGNLKLLLDNSEELKIDLNDVDRHGRTALMNACTTSGYDDGMTVLLECAKDKGIDVNVTDKFGETAFFLACKKSSEEDSIPIVDPETEETLDMSMFRLMTLMDVAKDLKMDLMIRTNDQHPEEKFHNKSGFDLLNEYDREELRKEYSDLVPNEETFKPA